MEVIKDEELNDICGGTSISGTIINSIINVIELLRDAGYSLGSGIRRIGENNLCSLD